MNSNSNPHLQEVHEVGVKVVDHIGLVALAHRVQVQPRVLDSNHESRIGTWVDLRLDQVTKFQTGPCRRRPLADFAKCLCAWVPSANVGPPPIPNAPKDIKQAHLEAQRQPGINRVNGHLRWGARGERVKPGRPGRAGAACRAGAWPSPSHAVQRQLSWGQLLRPSPPPGRRAPAAARCAAAAGPGVYKARGRPAAGWRRAGRTPLPVTRNPQPAHHPEDPDDVALQPGAGVVLCMHRHLAAGAG